MAPSISWKYGAFVLTSVFASIGYAAPQTLGTVCGWTYLGCAFYAGIERPIKTRYAPSVQVDTTKEDCQAICTLNKYSYAAMEDGWGCYCGNTMKASLSLEGYCNTPCFGNREQTCGGYISQSVYVNTCAVVSSVSSLSTTSFATTVVATPTGFPTFSFSLRPEPTTPTIPPPVETTPFLSLSLGPPTTTVESPPAEKPTISISIGLPSATEPAPVETPTLSVSIGIPSITEPPPVVTSTLSVPIGTPSESVPLPPVTTTSVSLSLGISTLTVIPLPSTSAPTSGRTEPLPATSSNFTVPTLSAWSHTRKPPCTTKYTLSMIAVTKTYTITSCAPTVTFCPYGSTTTSVSHYTTITPIASTHSPSPSLRSTTSRTTTTFMTTTRYTTITVAQKTSTNTESGTTTTTLPPSTKTLHLSLGEPLLTLTSEAPEEVPVDFGEIPKVSPSSSPPTNSTVVPQVPTPHITVNSAGRLFDMWNFGVFAWSFVVAVRLIVV